MQANVQSKNIKSHSALIEQIVGQLIRRRSTADVLFHHAIAVHLGLGAADHKCLDLLRERGAMASSDLAAITGLTSGAIAGVVKRLERSGYLRREPDPHDGRKQILYSVPERVRAIHAEVFVPLRDDMATALESFDTRQLAAIAEFLDRTTDVLYRHLALLRGHTLDPTRQDAREITPPVASKRLSATKQNRKARRERI